MRIASALLAVLCLAAPLAAQEGGASATRDALAAAQVLYANARYDDALKAFDALKAAGGHPTPAVIAIEQGRAFCLLALDRTADAQEAIEAMVRLDPSYMPAEDDASPKIRAAFRDVRRKTLAGVLQTVYERAKQAYERKAYEEAAAGFGQVLQLLEDPDLVLDAGPRADMRLVGRAFADLAKAASAPPAAPAQPPVSPTGAPPTGGAGTPGAGAGATRGGEASGAPSPVDGRGGARGSAPAGPLYDAASEDVTAPVPVRTGVRVPEVLQRALPTSDVVVEIVVSTDGAVESATIRQAPDAVFGALVTRAVMDWRYKPATRAGVPVRYRLMTRVVLSKQ